MKIAPSMMCANLLSLGEEVRAVEAAGADALHMDVMDGHFVPGFTFGADVVQMTKAVTSLPVEVHLMSDQPMRHIDAFLAAGADALIVHVETPLEGGRCLDRIRSQGVRCGLALNPSTPASAVESFLDEVDAILVMAVETGSVGSRLLRSSLEKAEFLVEQLGRRRLEYVEVIVDGGVKIENVNEIARLGVHQVVSGSGIFHRGGTGAAVRAMKLRLAGVTA